jgi:hypothetical protein
MKAIELPSPYSVSLDVSSVPLYCNAKRPTLLSMLSRIALRFLIAVALILQGGVGATAAFASGPNGHHCHSSMSHDGQAPKCPCCPAKSFGMSCADACMTVAALPSLPAAFNLPVTSISPPIERTPLVVAAIDTPLRPPIA